ncbi:MAG: methylated-DNA--[protein]-cysteine S-methyltransferase [Chloroflexi bacterium]|nr:methylated-DNA--[protein]-cysteine S-methyltransferase [Chloroflexota bacterium]
MRHERLWLTRLPASEVPWGRGIWLGIHPQVGWVRVAWAETPPLEPWPSARWEILPYDADAVTRYVSAMRAYFQGAREPFRGQPWATRGLTPFQIAVYEAVRAIPRGEVRTYGQIARAIGRPRAARAVGRALATNRLPLVIPCHRVIAAQGDLRGFSAPGGIAFKAQLLAWERTGQWSQSP